MIAQVVLNSREVVAKTLVKQGASYQTRPEWDLWHETFVHGADTGGVATIGSKYYLASLLRIFAVSANIPSAAKWTTGVAKLRKLLGPHTNAQKLPQ